MTPEQQMQQARLNALNSLQGRTPQQDALLRQETAKIATGGMPAGMQPQQASNAPNTPPAGSTPQIQQLLQQAKGQGQPGTQPGAAPQGGMPPPANFAANPPGMQPQPGMPPAPQTGAPNQQASLQAIQQLLQSRPQQGQGGGMPPQGQPQ